ncbi:MAG: response regulator [Nitrospirae bacterium]|nr:response regulator [Magnetococcales bacterium]
MSIAKANVSSILWIRSTLRGGRGGSYLALTLVLVVTGLLVGGVVAGVVYQTFLHEQETILLDVVRSRSRFIEHLAMDEATFHDKDSPEYQRFVEDVLKFPQEFIFGITGELMMGRQKGTQIEFLFAGHGQNAHQPDSVSLSGLLATSMQLALSGRRGTSEGYDDRGEQVLIAYAPLNRLGWGLVFKKDVKELRQPFIQAAWFAAALGILVIILGGVFSYRISHPVFRRLELSEEKCRGIFDTHEKVKAELNRYREHLEEMIQQRTEALEIARDAAEAGARVKESFLVTMSHEIRTPMNGVLGMAELVLKTSLTQKQRHYVDTIHRSGRVLLRIINDVLDLSKIHAGHMLLDIQMFDLGVLVRDVTDILSYRTKEKNLEFDVRMAPGIPVHLLGDPYRLSQILFNLLGNAIKFTTQGSVALWVDAVENQEAYVQLRFQVIDTGIGMSEAFQQHLFQAFSQEDSSVARRFGGTGLGLAISKHLLRLMDGDLEVASVSGQGTTFWFLVRFGKQRPGDHRGWVSWQTTQTPGLHSGARFEGNVLLVEDNWVNQEVAVATLESLGCRVTAVADGQQALALVCADDAAFDVVFMDLEMSGLDGMETTRRIRQWERQRGVGSAVPIIAVTAHAMLEVRQRCIASGMDDYLCKPFSQEEMGFLLGRWLPQDGVPEAVVSTESLLAVSAGDDCSQSDGSLAEHGENQSISSILEQETLGRILDLNQKSGGTLLEKMVAHYLVQTPELLRQLEQSLECRDSKGVRMAAHAVKSSSLVMGVRHLAQLGRLAEDDYANLEDVERHFKGMVPAFEEAGEALRDFLHACAKGVVAGGHHEVSTSVTADFSGIRWTRNLMDTIGNPYESHQSVLGIPRSHTASNLNVGGVSGSD